MAGISISKNRLLLDISLFYAFFLIGANYAMAGPVLIELSVRAGVSAGLMGYFFSSIAVGSIAGAFVTTFIGKLNIRNRLFPVIYLLMPAGPVWKQPATQDCPTTFYDYMPMPSGNKVEECVASVHFS